MRVGQVFSAIFNQYVVISRKQCILDIKLLQDGNRKPQASYRYFGKLAIQLTTPLLLHKPCNRFASVARVCQQQLAFLVLIFLRINNIVTRASCLVQRQKHLIESLNSLGLISNSKFMARLSDCMDLDGGHSRIGDHGRIAPPPWIRHCTTHVSATWICSGNFHGGHGG